MMNSEIKPLVTVITVTYNSMLYVRDAIESVLAQDYTNIEYIIADDCSTDKTWNIILEYKDPRIVRYCNEKNLGEYPNRNKAIDLATGKYLIFIDGDDIIYTHGVNFFVKQMETFSTAAFCVQKNYVNNLVYPFLLTPEQSILNYFFGNPSLLTSSFASNFFNTQLLKEVKGLSLLYRTGDEEIRLRLAIKHPVLFVAGWVSWPRETPGQASSKLSGGIGLLEMWEYSNRILSSNNLFSEDVKKKILNSLQRKVARLIFYKLKKAHFHQANELRKQVFFSWKNVLYFCLFPKISNDPFIRFTPANPYKQDSATIDFL